MRGFTLIELLVVVGIIAALSAIVLPQFSHFDQSKVLQDAASQLQVNLRVAQNNATSGVVCKTAASGIPAKSANNWNLLFKYNSGIVSYEVGPNLSGSNCDLQLTKQYSLPAGISIKHIGFVNQEPCYSTITEDPQNPDAQFRVKFMNISGEIEFDGAEDCLPDTASQMIITLQLDSDPKQVANIVVKKGGSIYIDSKE